MKELIFQDVGLEHIPLVNCWYSDVDSFHVEELTEDFIHYVVLNENYNSWMLICNDEFIGKLDAEVEENLLFVSILINPAHRRKGYGKKALQQVISRYKDTHITQIVAGIYYTNEASKRLFLSAGFTPLSKKPDEDGFINYVYRFEKR